MTNLRCLNWAITKLLAMPPAVFGSIILGDTNVEPVVTEFNAQYVEALTKITATEATVIQSVSMYTAHE